jgi:light-regulated signal transduction histidine kinase (bacteriophytochrome)
MTGLAVEDLLPPAVRARHVGHRAAFAADARVRPMGAGAELTAVRADGSTFPVEISLSPLQTDEGLLVTAVVRDITERKAAERRLVQQATELARSNAELEQFAYVASHDLQEPLRKVASFCQLLEQQYGDALDDKARLYIDYAVDGARRMQQLINDLLEYSRAGRAAADPEPVDLAAAVTRAVRNLETAIEEAHADVRIGPLPTLLGEGPRVVQLLQNLIGNAVKYRSRERPLRVDVLAEPVEHGVAVVVRDNGIGIRPEFADRIFEVFRRLHSREEYPGTGIGLALCRRIVERMGGTLVVESDGTSGSTFRAVLPAERVVRTA